MLMPASMLMLGRGPVHGSDKMWAMTFSSWLGKCGSGLYLPALSLYPTSMTESSDSAAPVCSCASMWILPVFSVVVASVVRRVWDLHPSFVILSGYPGALLVPSILCKRIL